MAETAFPAERRRKGTKRDKGIELRSTDTRVLKFWQDGGVAKRSQAWQQGVEESVRFSRDTFSILDAVRINA